VAVISGERDRKFGDPANIGRRGKARSQRRGRYDPGFTPTEQRVKAKLMRQFIKGYDGPRGTTEAYRSSAIWCEHPGCKRMNGGHTHDDAAEVEAR
jgi:hypothetical protein